MSEDNNGYRKPTSTRFKKGNREWTKRRPATQTGFREQYRDLMTEGIAVQQSSGKRYFSRMQVLIRAHSSGATNSNIGDADMLLTIHSKSAELGEMSVVTVVLEEEDMEYGAFPEKKTDKCR